MKISDRKILPCAFILSLFTLTAAAQTDGTSTSGSGMIIGERVTVTPSNETRIRVVDPDATQDSQTNLPTPPGAMRRGVLTTIASLRAEIHRLDTEDERIAALRSELEGNNSIANEDRERKERIIALRQQLLELEREDILLRARATADVLLAELDAARHQPPPSATSETPYNVAAPFANPRIREELVRLRDASGSFESLAAVVRGPAAGPEGQGVQPPNQALPLGRTNQGIYQRPGQNSRQRRQ